MFYAAFDGTIILYDPYLKDRSEWDAAIQTGRLTVVDKLDDLLSEADIVSVHVPLTRSTTDLIAAPQLRLMKPTSILINTARGGVVNEADLLDALEREVIFGAGLDAFVDEPPSLEKHTAFCQSDRVVLTYVTLRCNC